MSGKLLRILGGILLAIFLTILIIFEVRTAFNMIYSRKVDEVTLLTNLAKDRGNAAVSIDEIKVYAEVNQPAENGDVIELQGYDIKLKIDGELTDDSMANYGKYTYSASTDHKALTLSVERKTVKVSEFREALQAFWHGSKEDLVSSWGTNSSDLQYYQCTFKDGNVPVIYSEAEGMYYMFVDCDDNAYLIISSPNPFILTADKVSVHYGDPSANPQLHHTYSGYEEWAAAATIAELLEKDDNIDAGAYDNMYQSGGVTGTSDTYTSEADNNTRKQLVALGNFTWNRDGTSDETTYTVDINSENAHKSEWVLTSETYSYEYAGLKVYGLSGSRSNESFYVEGTISNTLESERPYVIVIKYLDTEGGLLGISVIDRRESQLLGKGAATFSMSITPTRDKIDIQKINSVMFEVY